MCGMYIADQAVHRAVSVKGAYGRAVPGDPFADVGAAQVCSCGRLSIGDPDVDRLASVGKITWYPEGDVPPDLGVCPSQPIAKPGKVHTVHGWSNPKDGLNGVPLNPDVDYGASDSFPFRLRPGAFTAGPNLQDCFLRWLVFSASWRSMGVRHPASGRLGT